MERDEVCVCGHPRQSHRTYGCTAWCPSPDPKKADRVWCQCRVFQAKKFMSSSENLRFVKTA
jgi:hypothetical protein